MNYKKSLGMRYTTAFRSKLESVWKCWYDPADTEKSGIYWDFRTGSRYYAKLRLVQEPQEEWTIIPGNLVEKFQPLCYNVQR